MNPKALGWEESYAKAKDFVSQLTLLEKVNITTGVGYALNPEAEHKKHSKTDLFVCLIAGKVNHVSVKSVQSLVSAFAAYAVSGFFQVC